MRKIAVPIVVLVLSSCQQQTSTSKDGVVKKKEPQNPKITALVETDAVSANPEDDAADDPAIWYNHSNPVKSLIIGTDKKNGLDVYDLDGNKLSSYPVGPVNNVDVRQDVLGGMDIVAGTNRANVSIDIWKVETDKLSLTYIGEISSNLPDVYGFCLHHNHTTGELYAFANSKTGIVEQWKIEYSDGFVSGTLVRQLGLSSQVEGMVADDEMGVIYIGEEGKGVFKFGTGINDRLEGEFIPNSDESNTNIEFDIEGLALYRQGNGNGYLIVSSQGNNSFAIFDRKPPHVYLGSFQISDGAIDGVEETDGIELLSLPLGPNYPNGIFICQDGFNYEGDIKVAQNFKYVPWHIIAESLSLSHQD